MKREEKLSLSTALHQMAGSQYQGKAVYPYIKLSWSESSLRLLPYF